MSAAWMKLAAVLCLSCSGLTDPESREMLWRECGKSVTIQCRSSEPQLKHLDLRKGLNKHVSVLQKSETSGQIEIGEEFTGRVQTNGAFPNVDVLIKNLSTDDTGPYWCIYRQANMPETEAKQGSGSVLVVVRGDMYTPARCTTPDHVLVLVWVMIASALLLGIITCVLVWLIKVDRRRAACCCCTTNPLLTCNACRHQTKTARLAEAVTYASVKPWPDPSNYVYEEMSATLRPPPGAAVQHETPGNVLNGDASLSV